MSLCMRYTQHFLRLVAKQGRVHARPLGLGLGVEWGMRVGNGSWEWVGTEERRVSEAGPGVQESPGQPVPSAGLHVTQTASPQTRPDPEQRCARSTWSQPCWNVSRGPALVPWCFLSCFLLQGGRGGGAQDAEGTARTPSRAGTSSRVDTRLHLCFPAWGMWQALLGGMSAHVGLGSASPWALSAEGAKSHCLEGT